jgi:creatinine amidohydrolase
MEISLFEQPHVEATRLVATGAPVFLTVNPVEFHGPHLSLHNDRLISRGLSRDLHARLAVANPSWPFLVGNDLEIGVEPCPGRGTRHTSYQTTRALVLEACQALHALGAERVILMTFHGAPLHNLALQAGVDWLTSRGVRALAPFHIALRRLLLLDELGPFGDALDPIEDPAERAAMERDLKIDFHAGFFETSMALYYAPHSVSPIHLTLPPCPPVVPDARLRAASFAARALRRDLLARELEFAAYGLGWNMLRPFPGYTGRPHLASIASGERFARYIVDAYQPTVEAVLDGREAPPTPIMPWMGALSAGGRVGAIPQPAMSEISLPPASWQPAS